MYAFFLFPSECGSGQRFDVLASLGLADVRHLLSQMSDLRDIDSGYWEIAGRDPVRSSPCTWRVSGRSCPPQKPRAVMGTWVHEPTPDQFKGTGSLSNLRYHVRPNAVFLKGTFNGESFRSLELHWPDVMLGLLAIAPPQEVRAAFRELADLAPEIAIDVVVVGLPPFGNGEKARDIMPLLAPKDLEPLLREGVGRSIRQTVIASLGRCGAQ